MQKSALPGSKVTLLVLLILWLTACSSVRQTPASAPATVQATPTATRTPKPTSSPTTTPTVDPDWDPRPTSTLLVPTASPEQAYQLTDWTVEKAEQLIGNLKNYPETLTREDRGYLGSLYYVAFQYEGLAELESALRFPHAEQAKQWQFDGAYNQYRSSSEDITRLYAGLIANVLNQKATTLQDFEIWANKHIPFQLTTYPNKPPQGYEQSLVLHFHTLEKEDFSGGFAIWLLEKEGRFSTYPLKNAWEIAYGDGYSTVGTADLTGDGIAEVIIQNSDWGSFGMHSGEMSIYRLDQVPPQKITFDAPPPDPSIADWSVDQNGSPAIITFQVRVSTTSDMPCGDFSAGWQYQWKHDKLEFIRFVPPTMEAMEEIPYCTRLMVSDLGQGSYLKNETALATYKQLLDLPFIAKLPWNQRPEEPNLIEKERFHLALFLSDQGDEGGAAEQLALIKASTEPSIVEWRKDALAYFAARKNPQALLQLCLTTQNCFLDWEEKIALIPPSRFSEVETILPQMGIDFHSSGNYDFDQDGQDETWLFFRNSGDCGCVNDLWILAKGKEKIHSRRVADLYLPAEVQADEKMEITPLAPFSGVLRYQVSVIAKENDSTEFSYWPMDQEDPTISQLEAAQMIFEIQNQLLLSQISPAEAQAQLHAIQNLPIQPDYWLSDIRAHTLYLLGLTQELTGDFQQAAQTYLELWHTYPDNPYAIMAFAKLEPAP